MIYSVPFQSNTWMINVSKTDIDTAEPVYLPNHVNNSRNERTIVNLFKVVVPFEFIRWYILCSLKLPHEWFMFQKWI